MADADASERTAHAIGPVPVIDERGLTIGVTIAPEPRVGPGVVRIALSHGDDATGWWIGLGADDRVVAGIGTILGPVSLTAGPPVAAGAEVAIVVQLPGIPGDRLELQVGMVAQGELATASAVIGARMLIANGPLRRGARSMRGGAAVQPFAGTISQLSVAPRKHPGNLGRAR